MDGQIYDPYPVGMDALQNDMRRGVQLESPRMVYQFCENSVERHRWGVPHNPDLIVDLFHGHHTLCPGAWSLLAFALVQTDHVFHCITVVVQSLMLT